MILSQVWRRITVPESVAPRLLGMVTRSGLRVNRDEFKNQKSSCIRSERGERRETSLKGSWVDPII
jgi:hypothetical protein